MSLDVYLNVDYEVESQGSGIWVRRHGSMEEIPRWEWDEMNPGHEPTILKKVRKTDCVYSANITHNLGKMADEAGLYLPCWRPKEYKSPEGHDQIEAKQKEGHYHGEGGAFDLEAKLPEVQAKDLIEPLEKGLALLESDPERFQALDSPNGWGRYIHFVPWVREYLAACRENPEAIVSVSR